MRTPALAGALALTLSAALAGDFLLPSAQAQAVAPAPAIVTPNRYGLPDVLPLDWTAFAAAMPAR